MIIDAHHHFWEYDPVEYNWIDDEMSAIRRDFLPVNLQETILETPVEGVVSIQARQSIEETDWLLKLASENEFIKGIVGWLPLRQRNIKDLLEKYSGFSALKGVRHVVQGEPEPEFLMGREFNRGIALLKDYGLAYDVLIFAHQLPAAIRFVKQHPEQLFVLDHIGKPEIKQNKITRWKQDLKELGRCDNVFCKVSGMVTEANYRTWTEEQLQPYLETVLDAFGPGRLLFGSDWPVCLVATEYSKWFDLVLRFFSTLSHDEQELIFGGNAQYVYHL
ncbi:amidohydrolase [Prolixibacter sp. NT017]|jgi:L-fuconolactonase|uniref:amidohydrolase family protein n=1 Tax=Prolixibacter sp. NT017 TaxID=2652390 RepID=UPI0012747AEA|nr:amidohydrolase family protein [Prolixibacter sp. NT017]GET24045.1 amidohydrolase [Prolixibacter sp. NT017]